MTTAKSLNSQIVRTVCASVGALFLVTASGSVTEGLAQEQDSQAFATKTSFEALAAAGGLRAGGAFPFDYQFLAFHGGTRDAVAVWAATSVHAGRVRGVFDGGWRYSLSMELELHQGDSLVASSAWRVDHVLSSEIPDWVFDGFPLQARVTVPPGEYTYRITVRDLNWPPDRSVNVIQGNLTVPAFDLSGPVISSVAVAADSGGTWDPGTWEPAAGVNLKLNAAAIVTRTARPYIFYEVYGLTPGATYEGDVSLLSTYAPRGQGEQFSGSHRPFRIQYRGTAPDDPTAPVRAVMRLDMSDTEPGPYEVQVRVTDEATGIESEVRTAELRVREYDSRRPTFDISEIDQGGANPGEEEQ